MTIILQTQIHTVSKGKIAIQRHDSSLINKYILFQELF